MAWRYCRRGRIGAHARTSRRRNRHRDRRQFAWSVRREALAPAGRVIIVGRSTGATSRRRKSLDRLPRDACDQIKILVYREDCEPQLLRCRSDEQIWNRWCPMLTAIGEDHLHLERTILHCRSQVLDRHERQRRNPECATPGLPLTARRIPAPIASPWTAARDLARFECSTRRVPLPVPTAFEHKPIYRSASSQLPRAIHHIRIREIGKCLCRLLPVLGSQRTSCDCDSVAFELPTQEFVTG